MNGSFIHGKYTTAMNMRTDLISIVSPALAITFIRGGISVECNEELGTVPGDILWLL